MVQTEMRPIDANALEQAMYEEAFEKETDMQRWDSGCWIRYKLFENVLSEQPTIDAVQVIRCKDCKRSMAYYHGEHSKLGTITYCCKRLLCDVKADDYCSMAERKEDGREENH